MTIRFSLLTLAGVLALIILIPCRADPPNLAQREVCFRGSDASADREGFIAACTEYIESTMAEPEERAVALANRGEAYIALGRFDDAMKDCRAALRVAARQFMTEKLCGDAFLFTGDADGASMHFTRAINATSVFLRGPWVGRIQAYLATKRYDDALEDANYLVEHARNDPDAWVLRGKVNLARIDYRAALADFEQALRLDPTSPGAEDGRDQATAALSGAPAGPARGAGVALPSIDGAPADADPLGAGLWYFGGGQLEKALTAANESIRRHPQLALAYILRCQVRAGLGEGEDQAISDCDKAVSLSGHGVIARYARASVLIGYGHAKAEIVELDALAGDASNRDVVIAQRCRARALAGIDLEKVLDECSRFTSASGEALLANTATALVRLRNGQFEEVVSQLDEFMRTAVSDADLYFLRGIAKRRLGHVAEGDADIAEATRRDRLVAKRFALYGIMP